MPSSPTLLTLPPFSSLPGQEHPPHHTIFCKGSSQPFSDIFSKELALVSPSGAECILPQLNSSLFFCGECPRKK